MEPVILENRQLPYAKTQTKISLVVTIKLVSVFVFASNFKHIYTYYTIRSGNVAPGLETPNT